MDYVAAAKAAGCSVFWIISREILPNAFNNLVVVATLEIGRAILLEAALSFLGMGVQPPVPSWGLMIAEGRELAKIAENIARALRLVLTEKSKRSMGAQTEDVQAYEYYLRGRQSSYNFVR